MIDYGMLVKQDKRTKEYVVYLEVDEEKRELNRFNFPESAEAHAGQIARLIHCSVFALYKTPQRLSL